MREPSSSNDVPLTRTHALISGFLLFHLVAIVCWSVPINSLLVTRIKDAVDPYMRDVGLAQGWPLFAPDPALLNTYLEAEIRYRDGDGILWKFPVPSDYGYARRYFKERYRHWNDILSQDAFSPLWPDAARYIARTHGHPDDPPVSVTLIRFWGRIPPPRVDAPAGPIVWHREVFFTYAVQPGDIK